MLFYLNLQNTSVNRGFDTQGFLARNFRVYLFAFGAKSFGLLFSKFHPRPEDLVNP